MKSIFAHYIWKMFDPFERVERAQHVCPCCERSYSSEEDDNFVKKLQQRQDAASAVEHMKVLDVEYSNAESHYQQLDKLRLVYEDYVKLGKETIPNAEKELQQLKEEMDDKSQALDDVLGALEQIKTDKDLVETLGQPVENADRLFLEIQHLQKEVEELEYKLDFQGQGVGTVKDIQLNLGSLWESR